MQTGGRDSPAEFSVSEHIGNSIWKLIKINDDQLHTTATTQSVNRTTTRTLQTLLKAERHVNEKRQQKVSQCGGGKGGCSSSKTCGTQCQNAVNFIKMRNEKGNCLLSLPLGQENRRHPKNIERKNNFIAA